MIAKLTIIGAYNYDNTIFDALTLPEGASVDSAVFTILERCGDFPLLYSDADFLKSAIAVWSSTCASIFERMYNTTQLTYNPIENYDRISDVSRNGTGSSSSTNINSKTAFNSGEFADTDKSTGASSGENHETLTDHTHGNIGATTSQQMIEQERRVSDWDFYTWLADKFASRFCIKIY